MGPIQSSRAGQKRAPMAEINVTPLVDVMLVLLMLAGLPLYWIAQREQPRLT